MVAFSLETVLLLAAAYFLGCVVACVLRRSLYRPAHVPAERRVDPLPEVLARGDSVRFAGAGGAAPAVIPVAPAPEPRPAPPSEPSAVVAAEPAPAPEPAPPPPEVEAIPPPAPVSPPEPAKPATEHASAAKPDAQQEVATAVAAPIAAAVVERAVQAATASAPATAAGPAQDLKRIRLIDAGTESLLNGLGVTRYEHIAAWTRDEVRRVTEQLGAKGRINQENWIEQAALLAKGGETHYSARRARGETATVAPVSGGADAVDQAGAQDAPSWPRAMSRVGVAATVVAPATAPLAPPPLVAERAAFAEETRVAPAAVPIRPAAEGADNLQRIGQITPEIEQALNAAGVSRYAQIAGWTAENVARIETELQLAGRVSRENWIEQAQILSRGGDTRFSREFDAQNGVAPAAVTRRSELGALRSVRSPALREASEGGEATERFAKGQPRGTDDLKRIRGIGVLIEKKLHALGVTSYEHIANWTAGDIDRISRSLDFKGRIERENWVEQARILSAGGHTEFSRRVDRGEVETSRAKP